MILRLCLCFSLCFNLVTSELLPNVKQLSNSATAVENFERYFEAIKHEANRLIDDEFNKLQAELKLSRRQSRKRSLTYGDVESQSNSYNDGLLTIVETIGGISGISICVVSVYNKTFVTILENSNERYNIHFGQWNETSKGIQLLSSISKPNIIDIEAFIVDNQLLVALVLNGNHNLRDPIVRKTQVFRVHSNGTWTVLQNILTVSMTKWKSFEFRGRTFLAQASYLRFKGKKILNAKCQQEKLKPAKAVVIYEWKKHGFVKLKAIGGSYVTDVEFCKVFGRHFLIVANQESVNHSHSVVLVYELLPDHNTGVRFQLFQKLPAVSPRDVHCFQVDDVYFLAVANEYRLVKGRRFYDVESTIFRYNGLFFAPYQQINSVGARKWSTYNQGSISFLHLYSQQLGSQQFLYTNNGWKRFTLPFLNNFNQVAYLTDGYYIAVGPSVSVLHWSNYSKIPDHSCFSLLRRFEKLSSDLNNNRAKLESSLERLHAIDFSAKIPAFYEINSPDEMQFRKLNLYLTTVEKRMRSLMDHSMDYRDRLVVDTLVTDKLIAATLDVDTVNEVDFTMFVNDIVKITPYSENHCFGNYSFKHVRCDGPTTFKGTLNNVWFHNIALLNRPNVFLVPKTIGNAFIKNNMIVDGTIDGISSRNILLKNGDQVIDTDLDIEGNVRAPSVVINNGIIDGFDWNWLIKSALYTNDKQMMVINGNLVINADMVVDELVVSGHVGRVDIIDLNKSVLICDESGDLFSNTFKHLEVFGDVSAKSVNSYEFPQQFVMLNSTEWNIPCITFSNLEANLLTINGLVNNLDLSKDVLTTHGFQIIKGCTNFEHVHFGNISAVKGVGLKPNVHFNQLKTRFMTVDDNMLPDFIKFKAAALNINDNINCNTVVFKSTVKFAGGITWMKDLFLRLVPVNGTELTVRAKSMDTTVFKKPILVKGNVNGVNIGELLRQSLCSFNGGLFNSSLSFTEKVLSTFVETSSVRTNDYSFYLNRFGATLTANGLVTLNSVYANEISISGTLSTINLVEFFNDSLLKGAKQYISGSKTIAGNLFVAGDVFDNFKVTKLLQVGSKNLHHLFKNAILVDDSLSIINSEVEFQRPIKIQSLTTNFIDGVNVYNLYFNSLFVNESRRLVVYELLTATAMKSLKVNRVNINNFLDKAAVFDKMSLRRFHFDKVVVKSKLKLTGTINGLQTSEFVSVNDKSVIFRNAKLFSGQVDICRALLTKRDIKHHFKSINEVVVVNKLLVDGNIILTTLDGIPWKHLLENATFKSSDRVLHVYNNVHFKELIAEKGLSVDGLLSGFNVTSLFANMLTIDESLTFHDNVTFAHKVIFAQSLSLENSALICMRNPNGQTRVTFGNVRILGPVMINGGLLVIGKQGDRTVQAKSIVLNELMLHGLLMGVNVTEWNNEAIKVDGPIMIPIEKKFDAVVITGNCRLVSQPFDDEKVMNNLRRCMAGKGFLYLDNINFYDEVIIRKYLATKNNEMCVIKKKLKTDLKSTLPFFKAKTTASFGSPIGIPAKESNIKSTNKFSLELKTEVDDENDMTPTVALPTTYLTDIDEYATMTTSSVYSKELWNEDLNLRMTIDKRVERLVTKHSTDIATKLTSGSFETFRDAVNHLIDTYSTEEIDLSTETSTEDFYAHQQKTVSELESHTIYPSDVKKEMAELMSSNDLITATETLQLDTDLTLASIEALHGTSIEEGQAIATIPVTDDSVVNSSTISSTYMPSTSSVTDETSYGAASSADFTAEIIVIKDVSKVDLTSDEAYTEDSSTASQMKVSLKISLPLTDETYITPTESVSKFELSNGTEISKATSKPLEVTSPTHITEVTRKTTKPELVEDKAVEPINKTLVPIIYCSNDSCEVSTQEEDLEFTSEVSAPDMIPSGLADLSIIGATLSSKVSSTILSEDYSTFKAESLKTKAETSEFVDAETITRIDLVSTLDDETGAFMSTDGLPTMKPEPRKEGFVAIQISPSEEGIDTFTLSSEMAELFDFSLTSETYLSDIMTEGGKSVATTDEIVETSTDDYSLSAVTDAPTVSVQQFTSLENEIATVEEDKKISSTLIQSFKGIPAQTETLDVSSSSRKTIEESTPFIGITSDVTGTGTDVTNEIQTVSATYSTSESATAIEFSSTGTIVESTKDVSESIGTITDITGTTSETLMVSSINEENDTMPGNVTTTKKAITNMATIGKPTAEKAVEPINKTTASLTSYDNVTDQALTGVEEDVKVEVKSSIGTTTWIGTEFTTVHKLESAAAFISEQILDKAETESTFSETDAFSTDYTETVTAVTKSSGIEEITKAFSSEMHSDSTTGFSMTYKTLETSPVSDSMKTDETFETSLGTMKDEFMSVTTLKTETLESTTDSRTLSDDVFASSSANKTLSEITKPLKTEFVTLTKSRIESEMTWTEIPETSQLASTSLATTIDDDSRVSFDETSFAAITESTHARPFAETEIEKWSRADEATTEYSSEVTLSDVTLTAMYSDSSTEPSSTYDIVEITSDFSEATDFDETSKSSFSIMKDGSAAVGSMLRTETIEGTTGSSVEEKSFSQILFATFPVDETLSEFTSTTELDLYDDIIETASPLTGSISDGQFFVSSTGVADFTGAESTITSTSKEDERDTMPDIVTTAKKALTNATIIGKLVPEKVVELTNGTTITSPTPYDNATYSTPTGEEEIKIAVKSSIDTTSGIETEFTTVYKLDSDMTHLAETFSNLLTEPGEAFTSEKKLDEPDAGLSFAETDVLSTDYTEARTAIAKSSIIEEITIAYSSEMSHSNMTSEMHSDTTTGFSATLEASSAFSNSTETDETLETSLGTMRDELVTFTKFKTETLESTTDSQTSSEEASSLSTDKTLSEITKLSKMTEFVQSTKDGTESEMPWTESSETYYKETIGPTRSIVKKTSFTPIPFVTFSVDETLSELISTSKFDTEDLIETAGPVTESTLADGQLFVPSTVVTYFTETESVITSKEDEIDTMPTKKAFTNATTIVKPIPEKVVELTNGTTITSPYGNATYSTPTEEEETKIAVESSIDTTTRVGTEFTIVYKLDSDMTHHSETYANLLTEPGETFTSEQILDKVETGSSFAETVVFSTEFTEARTAIAKSSIDEEITIAHSSEIPRSAVTSEMHSDTTTGFSATLEESSAVSDSRETDETLETSLGTTRDEFVNVTKLKTEMPESITDSRTLSPKEVFASMSTDQSLSDITKPLKTTEFVLVTKDATESEVTESPETFHKETIEGITGSIAEETSSTKLPFLVDETIPEFISTNLDVDDGMIEISSSETESTSDDQLFSPTELAYFTGAESTLTSSSTEGAMADIVTTKKTMTNATTIGKPITEKAVETNKTTSAPYENATFSTPTVTVEEKLKISVESTIGTATVIETEFTTIHTQSSDSTISTGVVTEVSDVLLPSAASIVKEQISGETEMETTGIPSGTSSTEPKTENVKLSKVEVDTTEHSSEITRTAETLTEMRSNLPTGFSTVSETREFVHIISEITDRDKTLKWSTSTETDETFTIATKSETGTQDEADSQTLLSKEALVHSSTDKTLSEITKPSLTTEFVLSTKLESEFVVAETASPTTSDIAHVSYMDMYTTMSDIASEASLATVTESPLVDDAYKRLDISSTSEVLLASDFPSITGIQLTSTVAETTFSSVDEENETGLYVDTTKGMTNATTMAKLVSEKAVELTNKTTVSSRAPYENATYQTPTDADLLNSSSTMIKTEFSTVHQFGSDSTISPESFATDVSESTMTDVPSSKVYTEMPIPVATQKPYKTDLPLDSAYRSPLIIHSYVISERSEISDASESEASESVDDSYTDWETKESSLESLTVSSTESSNGDVSDLIAELYSGLITLPDISELPDVSDLEIGDYSISLSKKFGITSTAAEPGLSTTDSIDEEISTSSEESLTTLSSASFDTEVTTYTFDHLVTNDRKTFFNEIFPVFTNLKPATISVLPAIFESDETSTALREVVTSTVPTITTDMLDELTDTKALRIELSTSIAVTGLKEVVSESLLTSEIRGETEILTDSYSTLEEISKTSHTNATATTLAEMDNRTARYDVTTKPASKATTIGKTVKEKAVAPTNKTTKAITTPCVNDSCVMSTQVREDDPSAMDTSSTEYTTSTETLDIYSDSDLQIDTSSTVLKQTYLEYLPDKTDVDSKAYLASMTETATKVMDLISTIETSTYDAETEDENATGSTKTNFDMETSPLATGITRHDQVTHSQIPGARFFSWIYSRKATDSVSTAEDPPLPDTLEESSDELTTADQTTTEGHSYSVALENDAPSTDSLPSSTPESSITSITETATNYGYFSFLTLPSYLKFFISMSSTASSSTVSDEFESSDTESSESLESFASETRATEQDMISKFTSDGIELEDKSASVLTVTSVETSTTGEFTALKDAMMVGVTKATLLEDFDETFDEEKSTTTTTIIDISTDSSANISFTPTAINDTLIINKIIGEKASENKVEIPDPKIIALSPHSNTSNAIYDVKHEDLAQKSLNAAPTSIKIKNETATTKDESVSVTSLDDAFKVTTSEFDEQLNETSIQDSSPIDVLLLKNSSKLTDSEKIQKPRVTHKRKTTSATSIKKIKVKGVKCETIEPTGYNDAVAEDEDSSTLSTEQTGFVTESSEELSSLWSTTEDE